MSRGALPKQCPACGGAISVSRGNETRAGWCCTTKGCAVFGFKDYDSFGVTEGKRISGDYDGVSALDKRITSLPVNVQIGILRKRQHG